MELASLWHAAGYWVCTGDFVFVLESVDPGYLMSAKMMPAYLFYEVEVEVEDVGEEAGKVKKGSATRNSV
jgi:hypothetical protein